MNAISSTAERVTLHTTDEVNLKIRNAAELRVVWAAQGGRPAIDRRLQELDQEWDIERYLETGAASISLLGVALGTTEDRRWFVLPAVVAGFLLQHAVQGWCPPLPVLRRAGVRTTDEINEERYALKALRGDFADVTTGSDASAIKQALQAARH